MYRLAVILAVTLTALGCGAARAPNVVLIVVDTLRADRLSLYGYSRPTTPYLARLATEAVVFDNAFTVMSHTLPAHVSLLTGVHPATHQVLSNGSVYQGSWPTLATRLRAAGYDTAGFVSGFPLLGTTGLAAGFDVYADVMVDGKMYNKLEGEFTNQRVLPWLAARSEKPFFAFVHFFDTHTPYTWPIERPPPFQVDKAFREHLAQLGIDGLQLEDVHHAPILFRDEPLELEQAANLYDNLIWRVDGLIEEIRAALERSGRLDETLFIVTSDHGEGLGQHDYYSHGLHLYEEQIRIPLIVRAPARAGWKPGRATGAVSLLDLVPTVLEMAGLPPDKALQGLTLAPGQRSRADRFLVAQRRTFPEAVDEPLSPFAADTGLRAVRGDGPLKYLRDGRGREELYDLADDPMEQRNLAAERPDACVDLRRVLDAQIAAFETGDPATAPELDDETSRRLEELGYIQ